MGSEAVEEHTPLLHSRPIKRTGRVWTAVAHIITGIIGSGVLSLAWSMAEVGWIAGPISMLFFASVTLLSTFLLCDCYLYPHPEFGPNRNRSYTVAARTILGKRHGWVCGLILQTSLVGGGIAYTVTSAISMRAIQKSNCYHKFGHEASCDYKDTLYMLLFGGAQLILSQTPDFHHMEWLSILAAIMSFTYSSIGLSLGFAQTLENGYVMGSITGNSATSKIDKVWDLAQALGDIAFAYPYSLILIEIQDTLQSPPPENRTMKRASAIALSITTFFYLCCGGFGYAAFGQNTPGNLLTGFGFYEPHWLVDLANASVVVHLLGGYQVYTQPLFAVIEKWFSEKYPDSSFINGNLTIKPTRFSTIKLNYFRLTFRTAYVVLTTVIAMMFPYFNEVIGLLGAINFWPLTIYFPVKMYFKQRNIEAWSVKWIMLQIFSTVCLLVAAFALVGSIEGLISAKLS